MDEQYLYFFESVIEGFKSGKKLVVFLLSKEDKEEFYNYFIHVYLNISIFDLFENTLSEEDKAKVQNLKIEMDDHLVIYCGKRNIKEIADTLKRYFEVNRCPDRTEKVIFDNLLYIQETEKDTLADIALKLQKIYSFYGVPFEIYGVNRDPARMYSANDDLILKN